MSLFHEPLFSRLLDLTPFSKRELEILIATAPKRYKNHFIDKRNGRGKRLISQPTAELKFLQRLVVKKELGSLPVHQAATAYRSNLSIKDHADPHAANRYLLKLDFKDFFPSIKDATVRYCLSRDTEYSEIELWMLCQLFCRRDSVTKQLQLSIGAPSSPFVSNYIMYEFDTKLTDFCDANGVRYTRYADDLALSTSQPKLLNTVEKKISDLLEELDYLGLRLNKEKTVNVSKKHKRTLVGLVMSNEGHVSVGRDKKRLLRAKMNYLIQGRLSPEQIGRLRGELAFVYSVDKEFVVSLLDRYGFPSIDGIS